MTTDRFESPKPTSFFSPSREARTTPFDDTPLNDARRRAERVITNDDAFAFDVRGARVPKSSIGETIREFDDEVFDESIFFSECPIDHTWPFYSNEYFIFTNYQLSIQNNFNCLQFKSTINKIRANKVKAANFSDDIDFDDAVDSFKRRGRAGLSDFDSATDESYGKSASSIKKSSYKVSTLRSVDLL